MPHFPVSSIHANGRKRATDPDKVESLADSIKQLGLLNPLTVTTDGRLVAGLHRLEAVRQLGWQEVPVNIVTLDALLLELAEIDENLIRSSLTELQEDIQIARRKEIYEILYPQTKNGANGRRGSGNGEIISRNDIMTFSEDTSSQMSKSRRVVERKAFIGSALRDVGHRLEGTQVANSQKGLMALAQMEESEREEIIDKLETFEASTIREAQRLIRQEEQSTMPDNMPASLIDRCQFICGELEDVEYLLEDKSVDAIIAHLPRQSDVYAYHALGIAASRILKQGGSLLCAVEQSQLPDAIEALRFDLFYRWTLALIPGNNPAMVVPPRVHTSWTPVLWLTKGTRQGHWIEDTTKSMSDLVERFTVPGQTILDPFMGSGHIVVPAVKMNRKVIGIGTLDALESVLKRLAEIQEEI